MPRRLVRLRSFYCTRIHRIEQQPRRWRQYFSLDQRGRALCGVPFFCEEFGGERYEWRHGRVCPRHLRRRAVRLRAFHATRFRYDRRYASQWRDHIRDDQRNGSLCHVRVRGDQPRFHLIFRRNFPARHLRGRDPRLHAFHAAAGLVFQYRGLQPAGFSPCKIQNSKAEACTP